jgi:hypothetical protein
MFCLSQAKHWCLPALVASVNTFVDDALRETQFDYYIEQLRSRMEFIDARMLPVQPYLVLPFPSAPERLASYILATGSG